MLVALFSAQLVLRGLFGRFTVPGERAHVPDVLPDRHARDHLLHRLLLPVLLVAVQFRLQLEYLTCKCYRVKSISL